LHALGRLEVQVTVLHPLGELRHPGHEILDPLAQPLDLRKQLALRVLVLRLAQLLRQAGQLAPRGGQFLAELLHRVETRAVKQVLEVEDVLLLLADLRLQRAIEPAKRAVAAGRAPRAAARRSHSACARISDSRLCSAAENTLIAWVGETPRWGPSTASLSFASRW